MEEEEEVRGSGSGSGRVKRCACGKAGRRLVVVGGGKGVVVESEAIGFLFGPLERWRKGRLYEI